MEINKELLPAVALNPNGDFGLSDIHGNQPWRFPNVAPILASRLFAAIYQDDRVRITPGCSRVKGDFEVIYILSSFYELLDVKMMLMHTFNGINRTTYPFIITSYITLPDELALYQYENDVEYISYTLDWLSQGASESVIKNINKNKWIYPISTVPMIKLTAMNDGSRKHGGTDELAEWRISCTFEYEIEVPSFLILQTDYVAEKIRVNIMVGSEYSYYENNTVASTMFSFEASTHHQIDKDLYRGMSHHGMDDSITELTDSTTFGFNTRYYHTISDVEAESVVDVEIVIPEEVSADSPIEVYSAGGRLIYGTHYIIENNNLVLKVANLTLVEGQIIEFYVYTRILFDD